MLKIPPTLASAEVAKESIVSAEVLQQPEVTIVSEKLGSPNSVVPIVAVVPNSGGNSLSSSSPIHPSNGSHIFGFNSMNAHLLDNPISNVPSNIAHEILGKIPAPTLDCSNPFSILEHCTLVEPIASASKSKYLLAAHSKMEVTTPNSLTLVTVPVSTFNLVNSPSTLTEISHPSVFITEDGYKECVIPRKANLMVDLSPFKVKVKRKSKNKGSTSFGPKTKSSNGLPSTTFV